MNAEPHSQALLRPMLAPDVPVLAAIFQASIEELTDEDYDDEQRDAWASAADDETAFAARLSNALTIIATVEGAPIGFAALEGKEHLDMLYVYPRLARQGVGSLLYDAIEKLAAGRGATRITVDSSDTAQPFFEAKGFEAHHRDTVEIGGCWLGRTRMQKTIAT